MDPTTAGMNNAQKDIFNLELKRLKLYQFKNYESIEISFDEHINCFLGNNGEGKTNLLDAIHYLCFTKSYFNAIDAQNIRNGEEQCSITGDFLRNEIPEELHCAIRKGQRKVLKRNNKEYDRLSEHIGHFPSVMITPYDIELILDGSEVRRKFIDATISQYSVNYLEQLIQYNHALQSRNNLLKQMGKSNAFMAEHLEPWDHRLDMHAQTIFSERQHFIDTFLPLFKEVYAYITGDKENPDIRYEHDDMSQGLLPLLEKNKDRDRILERTSAGPHKDDLDFMLGGISLKKFGSQGQQKSFLIALKLAQYLIITRKSGIYPILLLDDLYDKVDETRVSNLLKWLTEHHFGQIFITDTHVDRIPALLQRLDAKHKAFKIQNNNSQVIPPENEFAQ